MMAGKMPPTETPKFVFTEEHFLNRELSWLAFNSRVLDEAARADLPVLERVKFIAITASNLECNAAKLALIEGLNRDAATR